MLADGVEVLEFDAGIHGCEAPRDGRPIVVAVGDPGRDFRRQCGLGRDAPVQALPAQNAELDLGEAEPSAVLGRGVNLQLLSQPPGLGGFEGVVERAGFVRVEVVEHQDDALDVLDVDVNQFADGVGEVGTGAVVGDLGPALPQQGCRDQEEVGGAAPLVLGVVADRVAGERQQRGPHLADQLPTRLVETDERAQMDKPAHRTPDGLSRQTLLVGFLVVVRGVFHEHAVGHVERVQDALHLCQHVLREVAHKQVMIPQFTPTAVRLLCLVDGSTV